MNDDQDTGYTTTLKLMQIMYEKGLLRRDDSSKTHIYEPTSSEEDIQNQVVNNLVDKVFAGSTEKLVMRVLSTKKVNPDELANIKKIIEQKERDTK